MGHIGIIDRDIMVEIGRHGDMPHIEGKGKGYYRLINNNANYSFSCPAFPLPLPNWGWLGGWGN